MESETAEQTEIKEHLKGPGFLEEVLKDLTAEDLAACKSAQRVMVDVSEETISGNQKLTSTAIGVQLHVKTATGRFSTTSGDKVLLISGARRPFSFGLPITNQSAGCLPKQPHRSAPV